MKDDNDRLLAGDLPSDPFKDAQPFDTGEDGTRWEDPIPLTPISTVPLFPVDVFPWWLRDWTVAQAEALQCPPDLPAMLGLTVLSLCCAKKFRVQVRPDWSEPVNLYVVVALKSGESKSPAFAAATSPVVQFEVEERRRLEPDIRAAMAIHDVASKRIENLKQRAAKTDNPEDRSNLTRQIQDAVRDQAAIKIPVPIRMTVDDVTAESLELVLRQQGGRIAVMSDEGGPFELMGGRYSEGVPNIDIYLKGHSGSAISTDRIGRVGGTVRNPALTIGLAIQPDVITGLQTRRGFRGRGLLARFLWSIPVSRVGNRIARTKAVDWNTRIDYEFAVSTLLKAPCKRDEAGEIEPSTIALEDDAYELVIRLKERVEPLLGPSGELEGIADWGNKLAGTVVRLAGLLHLADRAHGEVSHVDPVGVDEMARAIAIAEYLCAHAQIAFDMMDAEPVTNKARYVLAWIRRTGAPSFTRQKAYQALRSGFKSPQEMEPALARLEEHHLIRQRPDRPRVGPGRPASPAFDVNPAVHAQNAQNSTPRPEVGSFVDSVHGLGSLDIPSDAPTDHDGSQSEEDHSDV